MRMVVRNAAVVLFEDAEGVPVADQDVAIYQNTVASMVTPVSGTTWWRSAGKAPTCGSWSG